MKICKNIRSLKIELNKIQKNKCLSLVPTMGYLHLGHLSLIKKAKTRKEFTVVSIFINPKQFGPKEDYDKYPVDIKNDIEKLKKLKVDLLFMPRKKEMFDYKISTYNYKPLKIENILCGRYRPNYFPGVADIIIRLFSIINPDKSYFGKKDYQQYIFIKTLLKKLGFKSKVISSKTIREKSGLAMSSRNQYLSIEEMKIANKLYKFLKLTKKDINDKKNISKSLIKYKNELLNAGFTKIDYLEVRTDDLRKANINSNNKRLFAAVFINETRLIDNIKV